MHELELAVYEHLEQVFGYRGDADFVGFYWEPGGDEFCYADGTFSGDTTPWGYLTWRHHPSVMAALRNYQLGSSDEPAQQWLILGRKARKLFVTGVEEAKAFLEQQPSLVKEMLSSMPVKEAQKLVEDAFDEALQKGVEAARRPGFTRDIMAEMAEERRQLALFRSWLDKQGVNGAAN